MALTLSVRSADRCLCLNGDLTGGLLGVLEPGVIDALRLVEPYDVDLSGINSIDETGVGLLLALKRCPSVSRFVRHSESVMHALAGKHRREREVTLQQLPSVDLVLG